MAVEPLDPTPTRDEGPGPESAPDAAAATVADALDQDDWEPGLPPLRAILPSAIGGAVVPLGVYYLVRSHVSSDAVALAIAGIPAAAWVCFQFLRLRRIDPIGAIVLFGFVAGLAVSYAMGGNAFVLKVRDSGFTFLFGLACVVSAKLAKKPLTYYVGRALSAGSDPERGRRYDELWELPPARATFRLINLVWGVGLMCDAATRVVLAADLSTKTFLAVSPIVGGAYIGSMGLFTVWIVGRSRHRGPLVSNIPAGGGSTWWWLRAYLVPLRQTAPGRPSEH
jgi:hypothetical protein